MLALLAQAVICFGFMSFECAARDPRSARDVRTGAEAVPLAAMEDLAAGLFTGAARCDLRRSQLEASLRLSWWKVHWKHTCEIQISGVTCRYDLEESKDLDKSSLYNFYVGVALMMFVGFGYLMTSRRPASVFLGFAHTMLVCGYCAAFACLIQNFQLSRHGPHYTWQRKRGPSCSPPTSRLSRPSRFLKSYGLGAVGYTAYITCLGVEFAILVEQSFNKDHTVSAPC